MSLAPAPPPGRREWTLPIITGTVVIIVTLALCLVGGATAYVAYLRRPAPAASGPVAASPTPPAAPPSAQPGRSGPECLIGNWLEVSETNWTEIYGTRVQLTGKGTVMRFGPDGVHLSLFDNNTLTGTAAGNSYEVIFNGKAQTNYQADATTIYYSNPITEGTGTWKVNGKVRTTEQIKMTLTPDTYKCQGNDLRLYSEDYAAELKRILPPGVPV